MIGRFSQLGVYRELLHSHEFYRVTIAGALALASYIWDMDGEVVSQVGIVLALVSVALNGLPIVREAILGLIRRQVNVDELVSIAIIASLIEGQFLAAAVVSFVMVLGALVERVTSDSAHRAIRSLIAIAPETATLLKDDQQHLIPVGEVMVGDLLLVRPGERIPVDGVIRKGITAVDESSMTGEPIPQEKTIDDEVLSGTLNQNGVVEIEATRIGGETALAKVIELVSEAEAAKPQAIRLIDRYARWFTPAILLCAGIAWAVTGNVSRAITVLIVGCPCALILAAPTAIVAALGRAARSGILIKGGLVLESAAHANVVLFDKTGTLTEGKPRVDRIASVSGYDEREILERAAAVEQNSTHPLARAVLDAAAEVRIKLGRVDEVFAEIGLGVRARVDGRLIEVGSAYVGGGSGNLPAALLRKLEHFKACGATPLVVYEEQLPLGIISVVDHVRSSGRKMISRLRTMGIEKLGMLSGDHEQAARLVAESVGVTDVWSKLKPKDKLLIIREYQSSGNKVIFVGDGINDAPALAAADVGIAMGAAGTDVALETADIALMNDDISRIPFLIWLGRRTMLIIKLNIAFGLVFNALAVLASGGGMLTPIMGALVHNIGSVLVVLSSASIAFIRES